MDVVYKLTNTVEGVQPKYYIGMKTECSLVTVGGREMIWCHRANRPYWSSSTSGVFKAHLERGDVFTVEILFQGNREEVQIQEARLLEETDAANNPDYYNLSNSSLHTISQTQIVNIYGETLKDVANCKSASSKRDGAAVRSGFENSAELALHIWEERCKGRSFVSIGEELGRERHFPRVFILNHDIEKVKIEIQIEALREEVRTLYAQGATLTKITELLGIEYFTARYFLNSFDVGSFVVAKKLLLTKEELEVRIGKLFLEGNELKDIAEMLGISDKSATRYFHRLVRRRLKISDLE